MRQISKEIYILQYSSVDVTEPYCSYLKSILNKSGKVILGGTYVCTDPKGPIAEFFAPIAGYGVTISSFFRKTVTEQYPREQARVQPRLFYY